MQIDLQNLKYEIVVIAQEHDVDSLIPPRFPFPVIKLKKSNTFTSDLVNRISRGLRTPLAKSKSKELKGFDFIFFLGCEVLPTNTPYGFVLWDLQHMTDPIFPEVGDLSIWSSRDKSSHLDLRRSSLVIAGTAIGKSQIVKFYGVDERHIEIIPHPVKYFEFPKSKKVDLNSPLKTFFYPAQFWAHKNHILLVKVAQILKGEGLNNFQFILTGSDKGNMKYVIERIRQAGVEDFFKVYGFVSEQELDIIYMETDVLIYPSFSGPENLPPLEALAKKIPVFISDYPGAREQLGENASYFNPKSELELLNLIKLFFENPSNFQPNNDQVEQLFEKRNGKYFASMLLASINERMITRDTWL
jgi:glycosyltransferase involved in cell wall biosynthesis